MPDYRLFKKGETLKAVNVLQQAQQDALTDRGYRILWNSVEAENAEAALLRYRQWQQQEEKSTQEFATESIISSVLSLIAR